ncbi:radical SAM/SPASM domain-containing protein, partial [Schnuerera sp.]|uniref:radical SAM/SPASM domain-containing protein n=1 Tax=Schnuerera sp. TaxID=2794844 RepID=UPI002C3538FB
MPNISNILFFGGEPLMSVDAIETICKIFEDKGVNFLMETNGTIYNEIIHEIIEKYGIKVTVSIDGPKEINDIHRKYPNGKGSYDDIVSNVFKLNKETENVCYLQGTYTKQSSELLDKDEIVNNLYRDLNIPRISIYNVVSKNKDITLTNMKKTAINGEVDKFFDDIFNCNINCNDSLKLILSSILSQSRYLYFCNAGVTQVSIDCNGDIWPCPLFTNKKGYNIGNIFDSIHLINLGFRNASMKLKILNKGNHQDCNNCIASFWCRKCVAESLIKDEAITINKNNCNEHVKLTEELLIKLTEIAMDGKLNEFTQKFEKNYSLELL